MTAIVEPGTPWRYDSDMKAFRNEFFPRYGSFHLYDFFCLVGMFYYLAGTSKLDIESRFKISLTSVHTEVNIRGRALEHPFVY